MQNRSLNAWRSSFNDWAVDLDNFKEIIQRESRRGEPLGGSDGTSVFYKRIRNFLRFLAEREKENDLEVIELMKLFSGYAHLEREDFRKALVQILDLCLKICQKFSEQQAAR